MAQHLWQEKIVNLRFVSGTLIQLDAGSILKIGGQSYKINDNLNCNIATTGLGGMDTGAIAPDATYYMYACKTNSGIGLVLSLSSSSPTGFNQFKLLGSCFTDNTSQLKALKDNSIPMVELSIGDIRTSTLTVIQFNALNPGTWMLMNGQTCVGTAYANLTGNTNVPDAYTEGMFLRQAISGRTLGSPQLDDFKSHTHIQNAHNHTQNAHSHSVPGRDSSGATANTSRVGIPSTGGAISDVSTSNETATNNAATAVNQNTGGTETRPKNIAVNYFIKVN